MTTVSTTYRFKTSRFGPGTSLWWLQVCLIEIDADGAVRALVFQLGNFGIRKLDATFCLDMTYEFLWNQRKTMEDHGRHEQNNYVILCDHVAPSNCIETPGLCTLQTWLTWLWGWNWFSGNPTRAAGRDCSQWGMLPPFDLDIEPMIKHSLCLPGFFAWLALPCHLQPCDPQRGLKMTRALYSRCIICFALGLGQSCWNSMFPNSVSICLFSLIMSDLIFGRLL